MHKIGATTNILRREGELQLHVPGGIEPIHYLETDDPFGIEAYWHRRFEDRRENGEWFRLTSDDVAAFVSRGRSMERYERVGTASPQCAGSLPARLPARRLRSVRLRAI